MNETQKLEKEKEIVIAQLQTAPPNLGFFDGDSAMTYSRDEIIQRIKDNDPVGLEYVKSTFDFLRAISNGEVLKKMADTDITHEKDPSHHQSRS